MEYYWELVLREGRTVQVKPGVVAAIRQKWNNKEIIHLNTESISPGDIVNFRQTSKVYTEQDLLEAASQAFNDPVYNDAGDIVARWVKKPVTTRDYRKLYNGLAGYRMLDEQDGMTTVAFVLPVHMIDTSKVAYCSKDEIKRLQKNN